jgi:hypothetical protein
MRYRRRLRSRIVFSFLALGTLLSGMLALSVLFLQNYLEDQLIGATLAQELDDYVAQLREDPNVVEPFYTRIQGYVTRPGDPNRSVSVPHPRWSQATERRIGELGRRPTLMFNGYAEQVASLYEGMDLKKYY